MNNEDKIKDEIKKQSNSFKKKAVEAVGSDPGQRIVQRNNVQEAFKKIYNFLVRQN